MAQSYRIGVDVGGTNTDSVILDVLAANGPNRGVVAHHKTPTTSPNVTRGIEAAVRSVLDQSRVAKGQIACLTIGTTHFVNAIAEQDARRLSKVAIIRLSKSFTREVPPFSDFPPVLKSLMNGYYGYVDGGLHIDGSQEAPINESQVVQECAVIKEKGIDAVVISGVFSPIDDHFHQEDHVRQIVRRELPQVDIVCSSEVSQLGLIERENASIFNASILKFARHTIRGFQASMQRLGLSCSLYLTQNDGTLIDAPSAARLPIRTFSSGPTNSMRGAAYLGLGGAEGKSGTASIVVDIGGTTTDIGVLLPSGFPRQASAYVTVAGVRINFGMPHLESVGLGGGSIVRVDDADGKVTVGPDSVGHNLTVKSRVFGGNSLTATDIAVAAGAEELGNSEVVKGLSEKTVGNAQTRIKILLESVIDRMKTSPEPLPVLLVGGGSVIAPTQLNGVSSVTCPPYHSVANAVGAAMSKVCGTVDVIQSSGEQTVAQIVEQAKATAVERAVAAGAVRETVYVAEVDSIPLQYVANQVRVITRAVGELSPEGVSFPGGTLDDGNEVDEQEIYYEGAKQEVHAEDSKTPAVDIPSYRPKVVKNPETGVYEWIISETDLAWISDGCYVLGCAGGGSPFTEYIRIRDQIRQGHKIRVVDASSLSRDAVVYWGGRVGSPAVGIERLANDETEQAFLDQMTYSNHDTFDAVMGVEIGGSNGLQPLALGSSKNHDRPVIDADWMGRAYPTCYQTTICIYTTGQVVPCAISSGDGCSLVIRETTDNTKLDGLLRATCAEMGSSAGTAAKPTTGERVQKYAVLNSLSFAWRIGRCIARAAATNTTSTVAEQIIDEAGGEESAKVLFRGKIVAVERRLWKGRSYGEITVQQVAREEMEEYVSAGADLTATSTKRASATPLASSGVLKIPFENENLYAKHVSDTGDETYLAMVPDLIAVLGTQSGLALGVPEFRYGVMVTVLGIACSTHWSGTERGLELGGPGAFGFSDLVYRPVGRYMKPRSVVEEFRDG